MDNVRVCQTHSLLRLWLKLGIWKASGTHMQLYYDEILNLADRLVRGTKSYLNIYLSKYVLLNIKYYILICWKEIYIILTIFWKRVLVPCSTMEILLFGMMFGLAQRNSVIMFIYLIPPRGWRTCWTMRLGICLACPLWVWSNPSGNFGCSYPSLPYSYGCYVMVGNP